MSCLAVRMKETLAFKQAKAVKNKEANVSFRTRLFGWIKVLCFQTKIPHCALHFASRNLNVNVVRMIVVFCGYFLIFEYLVYHAWVYSVVVCLQCMLYMFIMVEYGGENINELDKVRNRKWCFCILIRDKICKCT